MSKTSAPGQTPDPARQDTYQASIDALERVTATLPIGWQPSYLALTRSLRQMGSSARSDLVLSLPVVESGVMSILQSRPDHCVHGAIRKASVRLSQSCVRCGSLARRRLFEFDLTPQCAECWTPRVLTRELARMVRDVTSTSDTRQVYLESDLPALARQAVPEASWTALEVGKPRSTVRCLTRDALVAMVPDLKALQDDIAELLVCQP